MSYPIEIIKSCIHILEQGKPKTTISENLRPFLPYCVSSISEGLWIPLNRDYKPLGMLRGQWFDYEKYEFLFLKQEEINFNILWDNGMDFGRTSFFLYSDIYRPYKEELNRYIQILKLAFLSEKRNVSKNEFISFWQKKDYRSNYEEYKRNVERFDK